MKPKRYTIVAGTPRIAVQIVNKFIGSANIKEYADVNVNECIDYLVRACMRAHMFVFMCICMYVCAHVCVSA